MGDKYSRSNGEILLYIILVLAFIGLLSGIISEYICSDMAEKKGYQEGYSRAVDSVRARQSELFKEDSTILLEYVKSKR